LLHRSQSYACNDSKWEPGSGCGREFEFLELKNHLIISDKEIYAIVKNPL